jgi:homogentisate 1,2-dioxygenase
MTGLGHQFASPAVSGVVPHGPDADAFGKASNTAPAPHKLDNTLAFMFESRRRFRPTAWAIRDGALDARYAGCWAGLTDNFKTP